MTLNKSKLATDIKAAFDAAKAKKEPEDQTAVLVSKLAEAIDTYVRGGEVKTVKVNVDNGKQTGSAKLE